MPDRVRHDGIELSERISNMNAASTLVTSRPDRSLTTSDRVARGLGWFSLALGAAELIAPGRLGKALGLEGKETLLRAYGGRGVGAGVWGGPPTPAPPPPAPGARGRAGLRTPLAPPPRGRP